MDNQKLFPNLERHRLRKRMAALRQVSFAYANLAKKGDNRKERRREVARELRSLSRKLRNTPPFIDQRGNSVWPEGHFARFRNTHRASRWVKVEGRWRLRELHQPSHIDAPTQPPLPREP